jgi:hypothetical protein
MLSPGNISTITQMNLILILRQENHRRGKWIFGKEQFGKMAYLLPKQDGFVGVLTVTYSSVSNFVYTNTPNTQTTPDRVIARSAATRQSRRLHGLLRCIRNDDGFDLCVL